MNLRPYQRECIEAIFRDMRLQNSMLVSIATGGGKTIIFSELIKELLSRYSGMRIAVCAHSQQLVTQAYSKLRRVWPSCEEYIGIACNGVSKTVTVESRVVIGSVQTLTSWIKTHRLPPIHLFIVDEAHRIPPPDRESSYRTLLEAVRLEYPTSRLLGFTASPYIMGHGLIYGEGPKYVREGRRNWFPNLTYEVPMDYLIQNNFLVPYRAKHVVDVRDDLSAVPIRGGDYSEDVLSGIMQKQKHIDSAVKALREYGEGRRHVTTFCVNIAHAEKLTAAFRADGKKAGVVHSAMSLEERRHVLHEFDQGNLEIVCNVGVLTEGWDSPVVDVIEFCRPTKSPVLYVQMFGRGLRLDDDGGRGTNRKQDCLVLDLSQNCLTHGDPAHPNYVIPGTGGSSQVPFKFCPQCKEVNFAGATQCRTRGCGFYFELKEEPEKKGLSVVMQPVDFSRVDANVKKQMSLIPVTLKQVRLETRVSKSYGVPYLSLVLDCDCDDGRQLRAVENLFFGTVPVWLKERTTSVWSAITGGRPCPPTIEVALQQTDCIDVPEKIMLRVQKKKNGEKVYYHVASWVQITETP